MSLSLITYIKFQALESPPDVHNVCHQAPAHKGRCKAVTLGRIDQVTWRRDTLSIVRKDLNSCRESFAKPHWVGSRMSWMWMKKSTKKSFHTGYFTMCSLHQNIIQAFACQSQLPKVNLRASATDAEVPVARQENNIFNNWKRINWLMWEV